jgi:hypothetical protein
MKIGNLSKRASVLLVVLLLTTGVTVGYGCSVVLSRLLLNTYSAGTVVPSLPANVTINAPLNWGPVTQGQNYTLTRVLTNTGGTTGPLDLMVVYPPTPFNSNLTFPYLSWDAEGKTIPADGALNVTFTLQVSATTTPGAFNETISILD